MPRLSADVFGWSVPTPSSNKADIALALAASAAAAVLIYYQPMLLLALAGIPLLPYALRPAAALLLVFTSFSFFRLHEAIGDLNQLGLPLFFGSAGTAAFLYAALYKTEKIGGQARWMPLALLTTLIAGAAGSAPMTFSGEATMDQRVLILFVSITSVVAFWAWFYWLAELDGVRWGAEMVAFAIFFSLATLGMAFARDAEAAYGLWLSMYWKVAMTTLALAWLLRSWPNFVFVIFVIVGSGLVVSCVAIYNGLNGIDLVDGTRVTIARTLNLSAEELADYLAGKEGAMRGGSPLADPNDLALVLLFPFSFALAGALNAGWPKAIRLLCWVAIPALTVAIIFTQSRGGAMGILAVLSIVVIKKIKSRAVVLGLVAVTAVGLFFGMALSDRRAGETMASGLDESSEVRLHLWRAAATMAVTRPLTGVGMNNFNQHSREYALIWLPHDKAVHSTWFAVLAETGFPGFIAFVSMFILLVVSVFRIGSQIEADPELRRLLPMQLGLAAGLAGFGVASTFLTQHFTWPLYIQMGIAVAIVRYVQLQVRSEPARKPAWER